MAVDYADPRFATPTDFTVNGVTYTPDVREVYNPAGEGSNSYEWVGWTAIMPDGRRQDYGRTGAPISSIYTPTVHERGGLLGTGMDTGMLASFLVPGAMEALGATGAAGAAETAAAAGASEIGATTAAEMLAAQNAELLAAGFTEAELASGMAGLGELGAAGLPVAEQVGVAGGDAGAWGGGELFESGIAELPIEEQVGVAGSSAGGYGTAGEVVGDFSRWMEKATGVKIGPTASAIGNWIKNNKEISSVVLGGLSAAAKRSGDIDVQRLKDQSALDQLNLKQQQKLEDAARFSASVTGLRKPGLIGAAPVNAPLTRTDGGRVFSTGGLINRA